MSILWQLVSAGLFCGNSLARAWLGLPPDGRLALRIGNPLRQLLEHLRRGRSLLPAKHLDLRPTEEVMCAGMAACCSSKERRVGFQSTDVVFLG